MVDAAFLALFASGMERAAWAGQGYLGEVEPNGTSATASPIAGTNVVVRANLFPNGDIDFYSFTANAGDRIYAATMTSFSAGSSTDSQLTLLASDGTTVIEFDDDNGTFAGLSSSIAGAVIPTTGTYFLKVNDFTAGTTTERPYRAPSPGAERHAHTRSRAERHAGHREPAAGQRLGERRAQPGRGDRAGLVQLHAERRRHRLPLARPGSGARRRELERPARHGPLRRRGNQILVVDDAGTGDVAPNPNIPSEALFITVKTAGTYFAFVDSASAATGGPTATYNLSVSVHPAADEGVNCTTYTSTDVPQTIGPGTGLVSSTITRARPPADRRSRRSASNAQPYVL